MKTALQYLLFFCFFFSFTSCDKNRVFEENQDIAEFEWTYDDSLSFNISIYDNSPKNLYINFRHSQSFPKRNLRLNMEVKFPNGELKKHAVNVLLTEPNGMWFGKCSGDICAVPFPIKEYTNYSFKDSGIYEFTLSQDMRINPLPEIMSVGLRLENTAQ